MLTIELMSTAPSQSAAVTAYVAGSKRNKISVCLR